MCCFPFRRRLAIISSNYVSSRGRCQGVGTQLTTLVRVNTSSAGFPYRATSVEAAMISGIHLVFTLSM